MKKWAHKITTLTMREDDLLHDPDKYANRIEQHLNQEGIYGWENFSQEIKIYNNLRIYFFYFKQKT